MGRNFSTNEEIKNYVKECIKSLVKKFKDNPYYFIDLMEDDIVAYLYHLIATNDFFLKEINYKFQGRNDSGEKTKILQAQANTHDKVNKGTGRFDLAILNPEGGYLIAIEVKRIRDSLGTKKLLEAIKKDIDKLNNPENDVEFGYLLLFNCYQKYTDEFIKKVESLNKNQGRLKIGFFNSKKLYS